MNSATTRLTGTQQAEHFGDMAADWWNPHGSSAMLHKLNPVRLSYIRQHINDHWHIDARNRTPLRGKTALDMGCGAGLLSEPLARMGATVTGIDAAVNSIRVAQTHAQNSGLTIDYRVGGTDAVEDKTFDLITCLEVIEHVDNPGAFISVLAKCLSPGGLMILSTPNRTPLSKLAIIDLGETIGGIPRGTHNWDQFLTPDDLECMVARAGMMITDVQGISFNPSKGFILSDNVQLNYIVAVRHATQR